MFGLCWSLSTNPTDGQACVPNKAFFLCFSLQPRPAPRAPGDSPEGPWSSPAPAWLSWCSFCQQATELELPCGGPPLSPQPGVLLTFTGHWSMSGDILVCHLGEGVLLAHNGWRHDPESLGPSEGKAGMEEERTALKALTSP